MTILITDRIQGWNLRKETIPALFPKSQKSNHASISRNRQQSSYGTSEQSRTRWQPLDCQHPRVWQHPLRQTLHLHRILLHLARRNAGHRDHLALHHCVGKRRHQEPRSAKSREYHSHRRKASCEETHESYRRASNCPRHNRQQGRNPLTPSIQ